ncbi:hypothetical protein [Streptomyces rhizosphaerihabitans]|uniref:hypothetical protein n=1 Tax=Streptomyces rhizosphaerihabitans TaxID=1266770 RepID=UPI0021BF3EEA|nr:hypothetical protein [Streptomyces rhizosphaerihabitans]MCT9008333.1 hypothetical protein [Streptomyces rhizosphaerihabitans]
MTDRTTEDVYEKVAEVKTLLSGQQSTWVTKAHFDAAIKGFTKPKEEKKDDKKKEDEPGALEKSLPLSGLSDVITNLLKKDWIPATVAVLTALGLNKILNWDVLGKKLLARYELELKNDKFFGVGSPPKTGGQVPMTQLEIDRLKNMRSASVALSRSLSDLHKEAQRAAAQIA